MASNIGVLATYFASFAFGCFSIWAYFRFRYDRGLTVVAQDPIPLFQGISKDLESLSIEVAGRAIGPNVVFLSGYVINDGRGDLAPDMFEAPLAASPSEGWEVLDVALTRLPGSRSKLLPASRWENESLIVEFPGLLKRHEAFQFKMIAEYRSAAISDLSLSVEAERAITWSARIRDAYMRVIRGSVSTANRKFGWLGGLLFILSPNVVVLPLILLFSQTVDSRQYAPLVVVLAAIPLALGTVLATTWMFRLRHRSTYRALERQL